MQYQVGDEIHFWSLGVIRQGRIVKVNVSALLYTISFPDLDGMTWFSTLAESDIVGKVKAEIEVKCTCGSDTLGHPGHAHYCNLPRFK